MNSKIREIIATNAVCLATVLEVGQCLPEDDAEFDQWLGQAVANHDAAGFLYLCAAGLDRERPVSSRHLERGLQLVPDYHMACTFAWQARGEDLPEQVLLASHHGGISPTVLAALYFTVTEWCMEHGRSVPEEIGTAARVLACVKNPETETFAFLLAYGANTGDLRIMDLLVTPSLNKGETRGDIIEAGKTLGKYLIAVARGPIKSIIRVAPAPRRSGYTVRRAVEHIGRNDACPCGSGKKYKRCCFEKDQKRLQLSSDVAGLTHAEMEEHLEEHMTEARLAKTEVHQLARIDPKKLDPTLVEAFYIRLLRLGMVEDAVNALEKDDFVEETNQTWQNVAFAAGRDGRKDLLERLMTLRGEPSENWDFIHPAGALVLAKDEPERFLKELEEICLNAIKTNEGAALAAVGYGLLFTPLRALGILVARGALPVIPKQSASTLLDQILLAREKLDLSQDELFTDVVDKRFTEAGDTRGGKDTEALKLARRKLEAKAGEVRQMKHSLDQMKSELERREKAPPVKQRNVPQKSSTLVDEKELKELREKMHTLKADLKDRHAERAELRRELGKTLTDLETLREKQARELALEAPSKQADHEDSLTLPGDVDGNQPLRILTFPKKFHDTLEGFPRQVGRGALTLLGRLAAGEPAAFAGVVRLKECPETLRVRIGIDHRLLFRLSPESIEVVDLINRRDLEKRIKALRFGRL